MMLHTEVFAKKGSILCFVCTCSEYGEIPP